MPRVLIVDDNEQIRSTLTTLLSDQGHQVSSASNGAEALSLCREHRPDVIVSELLMPAMDGFRFCAEVRRDKELASVPFLILTGPYANEEDEELAARLGCDEFLRKRAEPSILIEAIQKHVSASRMALENREDAPDLSEDGQDHRLYTERLMVLMGQKVGELEAQRAALGRAEEDLNRHREIIEAGQSYNDLLLETTLDGHILADTEGKIIHVNQAYCDMTGFDAEELLVMNIRDLEVSLDPGEVEERINQFVEKGRSRFDTQHRTKDGSLVDLAVQISVADSKEGPLVAAFVRDVTEYEEMVSELRASEERFRSLFDRVPVSLWEDDFSQVFSALSELKESGVTDIRAHLDEYPEFLIHCIAGTKILNVNQATMDLFEASSKADLLGSMENIFTPASGEIAREVVVALAEGNEHFTGEGKATTLRGRTVDVWVSLHAPPPGSSSAPALVSMVDITSRKRAEEALRDRERQLDTLFKNLPGVAYRCKNDQNWTMELVSAGCESLTGHSPEALIGNRDLSWADLIHQEDRTHVWDSVQGGLVEGRPFQMVYRIRTKEGQEKFVWEQGEAVLDKDTGETFLEGFITDITKRVEAEEAENRAREELRALSRRLQQVREEERSALARELHDELGQTLTTLRLDIGVLSQALGETRPEVTESLARMEGTLDRNLAEVQGLSARLRPPVLDLLGLGPAIEWQIEEIGLRSSLEFDLDLPEAEMALPSGMSTAIFRIAQESLTNVIRHAEAKRVRVTLRSEGPSLFLEIQDDGKGIESRHLAGTDSLGLVGMRERAMALDGFLKVERVESGGTRVSLTLPIPG